MSEDKARSILEAAEKFTLRDIKRILQVTAFDELKALPVAVQSKQINDQLESEGLTRAQIICLGLALIMVNLPLLVMEHEEVLMKDAGVTQEATA